MVPKERMASRGSQCPHLLNHRCRTLGDFPGGPVVKTSLSNAGDAGSIPGRGARIPHALRPKN